MEPPSTVLLEASAESPAPAHPVLAFLPEEVVAERFKVVRFLGQGGMGQVYEAKDLELGVGVALKVVRPELARQPRVMERFKREVHLARQVTHPNVCRIFDLFQHKAESCWGRNDRPILFLTMELVRGETLATRLSRDGPFDPAQALALVQGMADALDAAHRAGVVHRDFKSSNVMLVGSGEGLRVVVTDFGLAQTAAGEPAMTARTSPAGTPAYAAPEVLAGGEATAASDVYSFGVVLYEMLTGTPPPRRLREPRSADSLRPGLDPVWEKVVQRCLERRPGLRFRSTGEAAEVLTGPGPGPPAHLRARTVAAALAMGLLGWAGSFHPGELIRPAPIEPPAGPEKARPSVTLLGFSNLDGDPESSWVSTALVETLATELAAGEKLRIIPQEQARQMREDLGFYETEELTGDDVGRLREYLASDFVILGSFQSLGNREIRLDVRVQEASSGETLIRLPSRAPEVEIFRRAQGLGAVLRRRLGVEPPDATVQRENEARAPQSVLEVNPEAFELYAKGIDKLRLFEFREAREQLERAARGAPGVASVHLALAMSWAAQGWDARAEASARQAFRLSATLPPHERLLIEGRYREILRDWPRAGEVYRELWRRFPDDPEYGLRLAAVETAAGRPLEALATVEEVRRSAERMGASTSTRVRIDLAEAEAAASRGEAKRQRQAAARAAAAGHALGAPLLFARARFLEAEALHNLGLREEAQAATAQVREIYEARAERRRLAEMLLSRFDVVRDEQFGLGLSYEDALEVFREVGDRRGTARILVRLARKRIQDDRLEEASETLREALEIAREIGNPLAESEALNRSGELAYHRQDFPGAVELFERAVEKARESGNLIHEARCLANLAGLISGSDPEKASERYEEALAIARHVGSRFLFGMTLSQSGNILLGLGDLPAADDRLREAFAIAEKIGSHRLMTLADQGLAQVHLARGNLDEARLLTERSIGRAEKHGTAGSADWLRLEAARTQILAGQPVAAEGRLRLLVKSTWPDERWRLEVHASLAEALLAQRRVQEARQVVEAFFSDLSPGRPEGPAQKYAMLVMARIEAASGRHGPARRTLELLEALAGETKNVHDELAVRLELGKVLLMAGDEKAGGAHLRAVAAKARRLGFTRIAEQAARAVRRPDPSSP